MTRPAKQNATMDSPNYIWEYFRYHASQRLTTFNFYIIICTLLGTGYLRAIDGSLGVAIVLALLFCFITFIFWKLDIRNKQIIDNARKAMRVIERNDERKSMQYREDPCLLFCYLDSQTENEKKKKSFWPWKVYYGYAECFRLVFVLFFFLGVLASLYSLTLIF